MIYSEWILLIVFSDSFFLTLLFTSISVKSSIDYKIGKGSISGPSDTKNNINKCKYRHRQINTTWMLSNCSSAVCMQRFTESSEKPRYHKQDQWKPKATNSSESNCPISLCFKSCIGALPNSWITSILCYFLPKRIQVKPQKTSLIRELASRSLNYEHSAARQAQHKCRIMQMNFWARQEDASGTTALSRNG